MKSEEPLITKTRRSYTEAFKEEAVRLVRESGHPVAQVARDLGIADHSALSVAGGAAAGG
jgi:transposase-like protein